MADEEEEQKTDALGRKVWDQDAAMERAKSNIMFGPERIGRRKDPVIPLPSSQRTYLKGRTVDLQLDKTLGQSKVVTAHTIKPMQGGFWCSVCECLIKDSASYLEHVNGRRHNRNLGMNMKVEKIGIDGVKAKLNAMRKDAEAPTEPEDIVARLAKIEEEAEERKRRKKEKKRKKKGGGDTEEKGDDDEDDEAPPLPKKAKLATEDEEAGDDADQEGEAEETEDMKMLKAMGLPTGFG